MSSQTPKFIMGGVKLSKNFVGSNTIKQITYSGFEAGVKAVPLVLAFSSFAYYRPAKIQMTADVEKGGN